MRNALFIIKYLGLGWIGFRIWKTISEKLGYWERRIPSASWPEIGEKFGDRAPHSPAEGAHQRLAAKDVRFFFDGDTLSNKAQKSTEFLLSESVGRQLLERNLSGQFPFFSGPHQQRGALPDWFQNPLTKQSATVDAHFSKINEFGYGDIKAIWELNRFGFVFELARSYAATNDPQCGARFWELFENWTDKNPPFTGMNWKCGQESGLRMIAIVFGYFTFRAHPAFTNNPALADRLVQFLLATSHRIERHISYAISQKNNHGISEAVALWTVGVLFPNLKQSNHWKRLGTDVLARLCKELIYEDGGFCQHSANYHRLLLHLLAWTARLADLNKIQLPDIVAERFRAATNLMWQILDTESGCVPRYGNDDGALLFPLDDCDYQDYRPTIQLCFAVIHQQKYLAAGPWDENLFWFDLDGLPNRSDNAAAQRSSPHGMESAGCHIVRQQKSFAFIRAGDFVHRPCQMDMLHVDLFANGNNIALDAGTYSYNGPGIWKDIPFSRSEVHNLVTVDGHEFANRVSKFLYLPWPTSRLVGSGEIDERAQYMLFKRSIQFQLDAAVSHWRLVIALPGENWTIIDYLDSKKDHLYRLHWLLSSKAEPPNEQGHIKMSFGDNFEYHMVSRCLTPQETTIVSGDRDTGRGFYAPRYFELSPALSYASQTTARQTQFVSLFGTQKHALDKLSNTEATPLTCQTNDQDARRTVEKHISEMLSLI